MQGSKITSNKSNVPIHKTDCDIFADILVNCIKTKDLDLKLKCVKVRNILGTSLFDTYVRCKTKDIK